MFNNKTDFESISDEVAYHIDLTRPKLVVCIAESVKAVQAAAEELHVTPMIVVHGQVPGYLSFDDTLKNHSKTKINNFKCSEVGENDIALIQATSGTTGNPKHSFRSQKSELIGIHCEVCILVMHPIFPPLQSMVIILFNQTPGTHAQVFCHRFCISGLCTTLLGDWNE